MRNSSVKSAFLLICVVHFLFEVQFWMPIWYFYLADIGISAHVILVCDLLFRLVVIACEYPAGKIVDLLSSRGSLILVAVLNIVTFLLIFHVTSWPMAVLSWMCWGVSWAVGSGVTYVVVSRLLIGRDSASLASHLGLMYGLGKVSVILSIWAGGFLYVLGSRLPMLCTVICSCLALALLLILPAGVSDGNSIRTSETARFMDTVSFKEVMSSYWFPIVVFSLLWGLQVIFQPIFIHKSVDPADASVLQVVYALAGVFAGLSLKYVVGAVRLEYTAAICLIISSIFASLLAYSNNYCYLLLSMFSLGFLFSVSQSFLDFAIVASYPISLKARVLAIVAVLAGSTIAIVRPLLLYLNDMWNYFLPVAAFSAFAVLFTLFSCSISKLKKRKC